MAAPAKGSRTNPTMTPTKMAKKYQACWAKPDGTGSNARTNATATGTIAFHDQADAFALAGLVGPLGPGAGAGIGVLRPPTAFDACVFIVIWPSLAGFVPLHSRCQPLPRVARVDRTPAKTDVYIRSQRRAASRVRAIPASKKMSPVRHRDEWQSPMTAQVNLLDRA